MIAVIDALGHETDLAYNLANQNSAIQFAATGETGAGRATFNNSYLYVGGANIYEYQTNGQDQTSIRTTSLRTE